jgi:hypothetical protein
MLAAGRRFWFINRIDGVEPYAVGPILVLKFKQFLPAGAYEKDGHLIERKKSLIQLYTDPGGIRTLAAADIRLRDPRRTGK